MKTDDNPFNFNVIRDGIIQGVTPDGNCMQAVFFRVGNRLRNVTLHNDRKNSKTLCIPAIGITQKSYPVLDLKTDHDNKLIVNTSPDRLSDDTDETECRVSGIYSIRGECFKFLYANQDTLGARVTSTQSVDDFESGTGICKVTYVPSPHQIDNGKQEIPVKIPKGDAETIAYYFRSHLLSLYPGEVRIAVHCFDHNGLTIECGWAYINTM